MKAPRPLTDADGMPAGEPSHTTWILLFAGKLRPIRTTGVPGAPLEGDADIVGVVADVEPVGMVNAAATRTMTPVAARSAQVARFADGVGVTSGAHRVPSQKDIWGSIRRPG